MARINKLNDEKVSKQLLIELERNTMALLANINTDTKKYGAFTGSDFYPLPYDTKPSKQEAKQLTDEEVMAKVKQRFKRYFKNGG